MVFVVIDGLDSAGKSTQAVRLYRYLTRRGKMVGLRFHPSNDNFFGIKAKQYLYSNDRSTRFVVAFFYMLDVIRSILLYSWRRYDYVIFTRYLIGTAYLPPPLHKIAYYFFASVVPTSDYMYFLDVSPEEAHRRMEQNRKTRETFETLEELRLTRLKAISLVSIGGWTIIDANGSAENVENEIVKDITRGSRSQT